MDTVNLVLTARTEPQWLEKIMALGSRLRVNEATELARAELRYERLGQGPPPPRESLDSLLAEAEVLYCMYVPSRLLARAPRLRWVHTFSTGVEHLEGTGLLESSIVITNARGVQAIPIAEHVLMFMLMFVKGMPRLLAQQRNKEWRRREPSTLGGKTVGVVGLGSIGSQVARLAGAFGMRVVATRRSAASRGEAAGVEVLYPPQELAALLAESDFVAITLPLTRETRHRIGERELRAMKPTAYLINVARGPIVDEVALVTALKQGWIAGAGLDVTEGEPLPPESPLWEMEKVILTPHLAGATDVYRERGAALFYENLKRYLDGQPLLNVVDKAKGY